MQLLFIAFIIFSCIILLYYLLIFSRFPSDKTSSDSKNQHPVSVLVCARNEAENLKHCIPKILNQNYTNFELILINDRSYDDTLEVMESFKEQYPSMVRIVNVAETKNGGSKKYALSLAIKIAYYEHLLFTDADCTPNSEYWISEMAGKFTNEKEIVLGYGAYKTVKNSFLNKLIRFETLMTALQYFSYSNIGLTYMGVGRNLAYTKSLFFKNNGFANHLHIKSGDDDLFVNQNATKENIALTINPKSFTISEPKATFKSWVQQKRRHISTANLYKPQYQFLLGLYAVSLLSFWVLFFVLVFNSIQVELVLGVFLLKTLVQFTLIYNTSKKLNEKGIWVFTPLLEIFLIVIQLFIFIKNLVSKPTHW